MNVSSLCHKVAYKARMVVEGQRCFRPMPITKNYTINGL